MHYTRDDVAEVVKALAFLAVLYFFIFYVLTPFYMAVFV